MKAKSLINIVALIVLAVIFASYMYFKPVPSIESKKADYTISAEQLIGAFEEDEDLANEKFLEKIIAVSGIISKITTENKITTVHLKSNNSISEVLVQMESGIDFTKKTEGFITLKGICSGYLMDVVLMQGTISKN